MMPGAGMCLARLGSSVWVSIHTSCIRRAPEAAPATPASAPSGQASDAPDRPGPDPVEELGPAAQKLKKGV
jgi:hypothetical protein